MSCHYYYSVADYEGFDNSKYKGLLYCPFCYRSEYKTLFIADPNCSTIDWYSYTISYQIIVANIRAWYIRKFKKHFAARKIQRAFRSHFYNPDHAFRRQRNRALAIEHGFRVEEDTTEEALWGDTTEQLDATSAILQGIPLAMVPGYSVEDAQRSTTDCDETSSTASRRQRNRVVKSDTTSVADTTSDAASDTTSDAASDAASTVWMHKEPEMPEDM